MALLPRGLRQGCLDILEAFEITTVGDVLTASEDAEVIAFVAERAQPERTAWTKLIDWARSKHEQIQQRIFAEGLSGHAPVASAPAYAPPPSSAAAATPVLQLPTSKKQKVGDIDQRDRAKRAKAAHAILDIVRAAGPLSGLQDEFTKDTVSEWENSYLDLLTGGATQAGFEHSTMQRAASAWSRWRRWLSMRHPDTNAFAPEPVVVSAFLKSTATKGPTAASGVFTSLDWLRRHARLTRLPLEASIVEHFRHQSAGHMPAQQKPLDIAGFGRLVSYLEQPAQAWNMRGSTGPARAFVLLEIRACPTRNARARREHAPHCCMAGSTR